MEVIDRVLGLGPFLIPIVAIIVGGAIAITAMVHVDEERLAKIERGITRCAESAAEIIMELDPWIRAVLDSDYCDHCWRSDCNHRFGAAASGAHCED